MNDTQGLALSGADADSLVAYQRAQDAFRCFVDDPVAHLDTAIAARPEMTMAHLFKAWLHLLGTEPTGLAVARDCIAATRVLPSNDREQRHRQAIELLAQGQWVAAGRALEDLSLLYPHDLLALQAGHQIDFFTGDARMLRDRIARVLPHWQRGMPAWHAILGMHAFGLEETGDYVQAERQGRTAVELEPRDGWAWHAVAHVHEMRNDPRAGIAWLAPHSATWATGSFFAVHNWWHLALFRLELGQVDEVLQLYDDTIGGPGSCVMLDLIDQSAILWRLVLRGVDVGDRMQALADRWRTAGEPGLYAFNDLHAMLAHAACGEDKAQQTLLDAMRHATTAPGDNAVFTRDVGEPAARAMQAFMRGDHATCTDLLRAVRSHSHRFGGSHAQRDLIDLTLIESARRGNLTALLQGLCNERERTRGLFVRPDNPPLALAA